MVSWLDRLQRRSRAAGFVIAVIYKYVDDQGGYLAALITYYAFVSLFPLLLLFTTRARGGAGRPLRVAEPGDELGAQPVPGDR